MVRAATVGGKKGVVVVGMSCEDPSSSGNGGVDGRRLDGGTHLQPVGLS